MRVADVLAFASLIAPQLLVAHGAPPMLPAELGDPVYLATVATRLTTVILIVTRLLAWSPKFEKLQLALFLAGMPVIYLWCALLRGTPADVGIQLLGLLVFGPCAVIGYLRMPWLLPAAIVAHGFAWDSWHYGAAYIRQGYAEGCLVVDIGFGLYGWLLLPRLTARATAEHEPFTRRSENES